MTGRRRAARRVAGALVALSLVAVGAGCGSSDDDAGTGASVATAATTEAPATTRESSDSDAKLAALYKGTFSDFPASASPPKEGVNLWVISLNEASPGVHYATQGVVDGAKALGWQTRVVDTKGAPDAATTGIKQAVAANADVIALNIIDCGVVESAAKQAKEAGVKLVALNAADCDAPNVGHEALFDANESFTPGGWYEYLRQLGQAQADWALNELGGQPGKVLRMHQTDNYGLAEVLDPTFADALKEGCPECEVVDVPFVYGDLNTQLKGKVQAALVKNPDAKLMFFPYDALLALGGAAAVQGSGRAGDLKVMGGECAASTVDLIRDGTVTACFGTPYTWVGWQTVDDVSRLLAGEPPAQPSVGFQLVDEDHNLPAAGHDYDGPGTDYSAEYRQLWTAAQ